MLRSLLTLALFASVVSCATAPQESKVAPDGVGIVALFEDQLSVVTSVKPQGKDLSPSTKSWNINDAFVQEYSTQLKALDRTPIVINLDLKAVSDLTNEARGLKDIYLGDRWQILTRYILDEAGKQGAHYVIMAHPFSSPTYKYFPAGYGVSCINTAGKKTDATAYFMMRAELWNVTTRRIEATSTVTPDQVSMVVDKTCTALKTGKGVDQQKDNFASLIKKITEFNLQSFGIRKSTRNK